MNSTAKVLTKGGVSTPSLSAWLGYAALLGALLWLVCFLPYAAGYADHRKTLAAWLSGGWADLTWQHGILVIPTTFFLAWRKKHQLTRLPIKPSVWGLLLALAAMLFFWAGYRGNFYYVGYASLHLMVVAIILWLWGWQHLRVLSFALFMLGFAWPFLFMEDVVAFKLRFLMVSLTEKTLNVLSIPTLQDGTRLVSAATEERAQGELFNMNVDGPCSGLRSLFALMMVSALFAYFRQRSWWRRSLLFLLSIPLAVLVNAVRILLLTFAAILFGERFALGQGDEYTSNFHLLTGLFVFVAALLLLRLAESLLNRFFKREAPLPVMEDR